MLSSSIYVSLKTIMTLLYNNGLKRNCFKQFLELADPSLPQCLCWAE